METATTKFILMDINADLHHVSILMERETLTAKVEWYGTESFRTECTIGQAFELIEGFMVLENYVD